MNTNRCCHFVLYLEYKKIIFFLSPLFVGSMYVFILTWGQMDFRRILVFASLTVHSLNFEKSWGISKSPLGEAHRWYVWHGIILWYSYIYIYRSISDPPPKAQTRGKKNPDRKRKVQQMKTSFFLLGTTQLHGIHTSKLDTSGWPFGRLGCFKSATGRSPSGLWRKWGTGDGETYLGKPSTSRSGKIRFKF